MTKFNFMPAILGLMLVAALLPAALPVAYAADRVTIEIEDNEYSDEYVVISVGDRVTWRNVGDNRHSVVEEDGEFDSGTLREGDSYTYIFRDEGTYEYYDRFYGSRSSGMRGTIVVRDEDDDDDDRVTCSPDDQIVDVDERVTFTARHGDGDYDWRAEDGSPRTGDGSRFTTRFDRPGFYTVTVRSDGHSDECEVEVRDDDAPVPPPVVGTTPLCTPSTQQARVNDFVSFSASGGNGTYYWIAAEGTTPTGTGSAYGTRFTTPGTKTVVLTSNGQNSTCLVQVTGGSVLGVSDIVTGPRETAFAALGLGLAGATASFAVIRRRRLL